MRKLTGSQIVAEVLLDHGVDTVFGYPGGQALNIYDELYRYSDRIHHVLTAHEQGASHAADGYARATGKTGVVFSTSGPGATNLVTGIATAYLDSVPMVAISSNVPDGLIGRDAFQEVYITGIVMPITKRAFFVNDIADLEETLREAFRIANSGRKGPVLVDITNDVSAATTEFENKAPLPVTPLPLIANEDAEEIAQMLNQAERPVAYVGGGAEASHAYWEVEELIRKADIPVVHTLMATGVVTADNEMDLGMVGMHGTVASNRAIDQADFVLALGARFSDRVAQNTEKWARKAKIAQVDIDHSEMNKIIAVDKSCVGDVKDFLQKMLPHVEKKSREEWHNLVISWKADQADVVPETAKIHPKDLMRKISEMVEKDAIIATDVGQHQMWAAQYIPQYNHSKFLTSGGLGTMGYGYGAAIGAQMGFPESRVIHITGDASFHMNLNEACTAVSNNLPIITIIIDNAVLGMVYQWQNLLYGGRFSNTTPERKTNFAAVAEGFGAKGYRVETMAEFEQAMAEAMTLNGPVWIDCQVDREERVLPMIPGGKTLNEIITD